MTIQPVPYPLNSPPIKSISLQFREKDVVGDRVKDLAEVQKGEICSSSLVHCRSHSIHKATRLVRQDLQDLESSPRPSVFG